MGTDRWDPSKKSSIICRLTSSEWYRGSQLGDSYWLYVVWDPLDLPAPSATRQAGNPIPEPLRIQNPVKHLDHAKREVVALRNSDVPAEAVEQATSQQGH